MSIAGLLLIGIAALLVPIADAASVSPSMMWIGPWTSAGSQVTFVSTLHKQTELWTEKFGSSTLKRIAPAGCGMGEIDQLAIGPKGSVACLSASQSNSESDYAVNYLSRSGVIKPVASAGGPGGLEGGPPVDSIPLVLGDSSFLGYLHVTADGIVQLMRITSGGHGRHVADLAGVSNPEAVVIDSGNIAVTQGGTVYVYTVAGKNLSTIATGARLLNAIAIRKDRIVVRVSSRRLAVYTLRGKRVHSYPIHSALGAAMDLATYYGYAVYVGGGNAVRALKLSTGKDVVIAQAGKGWFGNGLSLQAPGVVVPRTVKRGTQYPMKLVFIRMSTIRAKLS